MGMTTWAEKLECAVKKRSRGNTLSERIASKFRIDAKGCWRWTGYVAPSGYARQTWTMPGDGKKRSHSAHRLSYMMFKGDLIDGMEIDHLCRVRDCINPAHLEQVTRRVNTLRSNAPSAKNAVKTRCPKGHPYSGKNLYTGPNGARYCRICTRENARRYCKRKALAKLAAKVGAEARRDK